MEHFEGVVVARARLGVYRGGRGAWHVWVNMAVVLVAVGFEPLMVKQEVKKLIFD